MRSSRILVKLGLPTPLYYSSRDQITWGGNLYIPKSMKIPKIQISASVNWSIEINDDDWALCDDLNANHTDWGNFEVTATKITRAAGSATWYATDTIIMTKTEAAQDMNTRWMKIDLSSTVGLNKKACLLEGSRTIFPLAPAPDAVINHGGRQVRFGGGHRSLPEQPGGEEPRYQGSNWRRPQGRLIDDITLRERAAAPPDLSDNTGGSNLL